eukprot:5356048-Alexandrium_andersonii.AAC.1
MMWSRRWSTLALVQVSRRAVSSTKEMLLRYGGRSGVLRLVGHVGVKGNGLGLGMGMPIWLSVRVCWMCCNLSCMTLTKGCRQVDHPVGCL